MVAFVKPCRNIHKVVEAWTKGDTDILITFEALEETGVIKDKEIKDSPDVLRICKGYSPDKEGNCLLYKDCTVTGLSDGKRTIKNRNQVAAAGLINIFLQQILLTYLKNRGQNFTMKSCLLS